MSQFHANEADVRFDFEAADRLMTRFRTTAAQLQTQIGWRRSLAAVARQEWRGRYGERFDARTDECVVGAEMLAESMNDAARRVQSLVDAAREEQQRRMLARQWEIDQEHRSTIEKIEDALFGEDPPPTIVSPTPPPSQDVVLRHYIGSSRD